MTMPNLSVAVKSDVSVRKTDDLFSILFLNNLILPGDELDVSGRVHGWIATDCENGKQVGFCTSSYCGSGIMFLSRSGLVSTHRGRNLQRRFITVRERHAIKLGCNSIITYVHKTNYRSLSNLIKCNYLIYTPEYDYAGAEFVYLIKYI